MSRYEIKKRRDRLGRMRWRVVLVADNNKVLSVSEGLNSLASAHTNIDAQRAAAPDAPIVEK